ncbi:MAG TPA: hypothetical protein IAB47_01485 [Candidatus Scatomorpha merdigallinarum]|nr:hypothetical protein [Candidatus Scatomorpha merdigallinarum]
MLPILATFIILLIFGVGDIVATKTKAIVSMLFLSSVIFLAGFWTGILPSTLFNDSTLLSVSGVLVCMLLVHMGTTIKVRDFIDQWKTVVVAAVCCIAISLGIYFIGGLIIDRNYAIVGAPILSGGVVATLTMQDAANKLGLTDLAIFAALVMVVQGFVGYPVASLCLRSEAKRVRKLVETGAELKGVTATISSENAPVKKRLIPPIPDKYNGANVIMAKVALIGFLATITANGVNGWIADATGSAFTISNLIFALIYGVICKELGFLEEGPMGKASADGFMLVVVTLSVFTNLGSSTPQQVLGMLWPLIVVVVTGSVTFMVLGTLVGKLVGMSWQMACAIGSTCLFGFPGTYIVTNEVVNAIAADEKEKKLMLDHMMPKMLVAGMVTVSITSVLIAGYMCNLIAA